MPKKSNSVDVLFLSHRYEITSGGEKALLEQITYLTSLNMRLHVVIGGKGDIVDRLNKLGVPYTIVHLPFWAHGGEDISPFIFDQPTNPSNNTMLKLVDLINVLQPKLCVTNTIVVPWLAYASAITNTSHAWMIHELDTSGLDLRYAIDKEQILRTVDILSDKIFYNSNYTANYYLPKFSLNKKSSVIYPGGTIKKHHRVDSPFKTKGLKIISVGQIKEQKGQLDAVRAARLLKDKEIVFEMLLVGAVNNEDRKYSDNLRQLIADAGLEDTVRLMGHSDNPVGLMEHADIALNCATNETFGRVTVEAMLSGAAVIGADSAGTAEIIKHDVTGLLYKPGDYPQLAEELGQLYKNAAKLNRLASRGQDVARTKYSDEERFKPFVDYLKTNPKRTSLNLAPLMSAFSDFQQTVILARKKSPVYPQVVRKMKRLLGRMLKRS